MCLYFLILKKKRLKVELIMKKDFGSSFKKIFVILVIN